MKLLLTSAGLTNHTIINALHRLAGRDLRFAFIPTAANMEDGEKGWLVENFVECMTLGHLDIIDISALPREAWLPRLQKANVIVMGGGDTPYLMNWVLKSGLDKELPELLQGRVYVGISAGSIILSTILNARSEFIYGDETSDTPAGLGSIGFHIRPHLNSTHFPRVRLENLEPIAKQLSGDLYAIDDDTAIIVDGDIIEVVSEGTWKRFEHSR